MEAGMTRTRTGIPSSKALELTGAGVPSWLLLEKGSIQQAWPWCLWTRSWEWWDVPRGSCSHGISLGMSPSRPVPKPRCIPSPRARWMWYFPELPVLLAFVLLQSCRSLPPKLPWSSGIVWGQETWKGSLVGPCWVPCPARVCHSWGVPPAAPVLYSAKYWTNSMPLLPEPQTLSWKPVVLSESLKKGGFLQWCLCNDSKVRSLRMLCARALGTLYFTLSQLSEGFFSLVYQFSTGMILHCNSYILLSLE